MKDVNLKGKEVRYLVIKATYQNILPSRNSVSIECSKINEVYGGPENLRKAEFNLYSLVIDLEVLNYTWKHEGKPKEEWKRFESSVSNINRPCIVPADTLIRKIFEEIDHPF